MPETIPEVPELAALELGHRPALAPLLARVEPQVSEVTFTNLYIWRHAYGAHVTRLGDVVCVFSLRADPEDSFLLPPVGPGAGADEVRACLGLLADRGHDAKLCRADARELARLGITGDDFDVARDRDNDDYVYRVRDLIDLAGDAYADKRHHVNAFTRKFDYEYRPITPDLVEGCQYLQSLWCDEKHCDLYSSLRAEARAVNEVLENLEALGVAGGAILVNDRVQAFTLGEALNPDTVVIHIEKASPDLHGAFQVINRDFLAHEWAGCEYVNREQDLGVAGLRHAKESYHPVRRVAKYVVRPRR